MTSNDRCVSSATDGGGGGGGGGVGNRSNVIIGIEVSSGGHTSAFRPHRGSLMRLTFGEYTDMPGPFTLIAGQPSSFGAHPRRPVLTSSLYAALDSTPTARPTLARSVRLKEAPSAGPLGKIELEFVYTIG